MKLIQTFFFSSILIRHASVGYLCRLLIRNTRGMARVVVIVRLQYRSQVFFCMAFTTKRHLPTTD